ncbi:MAG: hypothetical protein EAY75_16405 [Bacteroidetes bacterium]|nr:MAG: hypothetical protein EAY75_16405 [Bacteroidota bacterium]
MKNFREWLMPFWFFLFALMGVGGTALFTWLRTSSLPPLEQLLTSGSLVGIVLGGTAVLALYHFETNRNRQRH